MCIKQCSLTFNESYTEGLLPVTVIQDKSLRPRLSPHSWGGGSLLVNQDNPGPGALSSLSEVTQPGRWNRWGLIADPLPLKSRRSAASFAEPAAFWKVLVVPWRQAPHLGRTQPGGFVPVSLFLWVWLKADPEMGRAGRQFTWGRGSAG